MISLAMSLDEKRAVAGKAQRKLGRLCRSARIAGGYPRDITINRVLPKDIDVFINALDYPSEEERDAVATRIYTAFGQTWVKDMPAETPGQMTLNPYTHPTGPIEEGFSVYFMGTNTGQWEGLNLIFSNGNERLYNFDFNVCDFRMESSGHILYSARQLDLLNVLVNPGVGHDNRVQRVVDHGMRLRRKYPEMQFKITPEFALAFPDTYIQLIHGGLLNVPRPVLPTQGEVPARDEVRQQPGAEVTQPAGDVAVFDEAPVFPDGQHPFTNPTWVRDAEERQRRAQQSRERVNAAIASMQRNNAGWFTTTFSGGISRG